MLLKIKLITYFLDNKNRKNIKLTDLGRQTWEKINEIVKGSESIVLVEDDKDLLDFAENALKSFGYRVVSYDNPKVALQEIPKLTQKIDLIITDVIMPGLNGKEFIEYLSKERKDFKVLYSSGYADDYIMESGILKDEVQFLSKPYNLHTLSNAIRKILNNPNS